MRRSRGVWEKLIDFNDRFPGWAAAPGGSERPRGRRGGEGRGTASAGGTEGCWGHGGVLGAAGRCAARVRAAGGSKVSWSAISSEGRSRSWGFLLGASVQPRWHL